MMVLRAVATNFGARLPGIDEPANIGTAHPCDERPVLGSADGWCGDRGGPKAERLWSELGNEQTFLLQTVATRTRHVAETRLICDPPPGRSCARRRAKYGEIRQRQRALGYDLSRSLINARVSSHVRSIPETSNSVFEASRMLRPLSSADRTASIGCGGTQDLCAARSKGQNHRAEV